MEATVRHHFDQGVDRLFALMTDGDFLKRRAESVGELNVVVRADRQGQGLSIRIDRDLERNMPAFMKKVFNSKNHLVDLQTWETGGDVKTSSWTVQIEGQKRIDIRGRLTLSSSAGGGCDYTESFTVTVHIPLIGGRIEKYIAGETEQTIRRQLDFTRKELG